MNNKTRVILWGKWHRLKNKCIDKYYQQCHSNSDSHIKILKICLPKQPWDEFSNILLGVTMVDDIHLSQE